MKLSDSQTATPERRISGAGAAHLGYRMFGARGPCLAPEDGAGSGGGSGDGGGGDGGDGDDGGNAGASGGAPVVTMTQAELDALVQRRIDRDRASRSKNGQQQQQGRQQQQRSPATTTTTNNADSAPASDAWRFDFEDAYEEVTEELGANPTKAAKRRLREAFATARPSDPHAWVKGWLEDFGAVKSNGTTTTTTTNTSNTTAGDSSPKGTTVKQPPVSDKGAANGGAREFDAIQNPNELTKSDVDRLIAKHGEQKAHAMIGQMSVRWLQQVRLKIDRARK